MIGIVVAFLIGAQSSGPPDLAPFCLPPAAIEFESASAALPPRGQAMLDMLAPGFVRWNDQVGISASRLVDRRLSRRRARAIADYLVQRGIPHSRIRLFFVAGEYGQRHEIWLSNVLTREERRRRRMAYIQAGHGNLVC